MHILIKIFLLVFAIHSPLNAVGEASSKYADNSSEIQPEKTDRKPFGEPALYAIHHQAESQAEITNRVPQPQPSTGREYDLFKSSVPESAIEQWVTFYIRSGNLIETGLIPGKLLFPFHFFL